ncbi:hypothetical protein GCM10007079_37190 [Nocardiopsis terrae]|uniref:DUF1109 domain-containing protein n=1 Tax=Nocardiopsis terrae TaxID=372655 RepID=A0ABR9HE78_9ACTN|nr:hypothetical protein [Nocardiopsis terrae]MBE1457110.1 hypothetical protein [Nocardiopsis terrae]GHC90704.1 hypothetical protein GCM10007079_37190 [Nocardiopsis terrae]
MSASASGPTPDGSVAKLIEIAEKPTLGQRLISWASRPPGRLYIPACSVIGLVLLFEDSVPAGHLPTFFVGLGAGLLLAGMGALRLGIALAVARPMIRHYWLRWISAPLIAFAALGLAVADVPLQLRVQASAEQLLELREEVADPTTIPRNGEWTGLYSLRSVSETDGVTHYEVADAGLFQPAGLAYSSEEIPVGVFVPGQDSRIYEHVSGDWYVWVDH